MKKMDMISMDKLSDNISRIEKIFPHAVFEIEEGKKAIDFEILRQELTNELIEGKTENMLFHGLINEKR